MHAFVPLRSCMCYLVGLGWCCDILELKEKEKKQHDEVKRDRDESAVSGAADVGASSSSGGDELPMAVVVSVAPAVAPVPTAPPLGLLSLPAAADLRLNWNVKPQQLIYKTPTYRAHGFQPPREIVHSAVTGKPYIEQLQRLEWQRRGSAGLDRIYALEDGSLHAAEIDVTGRSEGHGKRRAGGTFQFVCPSIRHTSTTKPVIELVMFDTVANHVFTVSPASVKDARTWYRCVATAAETGETGGGGDESGIRGLAGEQERVSA